MNYQHPVYRTWGQKSLSASVVASIFEGQFDF